MKFKIVIICLFLITVFNVNLFSQDSNTNNSTNSTQSEIEELRRREEELRRREARIRQREAEMRRRERGIVDRTNMDEELRRREAARRERARRRQELNETEKLKSKDKYQINVLGGITYLLNPIKRDNIESNNLGSIMGLGFLYAINNELNVKVGVELGFATNLSNFTYYYSTETYKAKYQGFSLMLNARYEFLHRKKGDTFIPYAGVCIGLWFPIITSSPNETNDKINTTIGIEGGFDIWLNKFFALSLKIRFLYTKYNTVGDAPDVEAKSLFFLMPMLGIAFSF